MKRARLLLAAGSFLAVILALSLVELGLRWCGYGRPAHVFRAVEQPDGSHLVRPNAGVFAIERQTGVSLATVPFLAEKPAHTFRVFALGASTTYGRPLEPRSSFSRLLERLLVRHPEPDPDARRPEVLNAGLPAASSAHVRRIAEEALEFSPDAIILYAGHNDFGFASQFEGGALASMGRALGGLALVEALSNLLPTSNGRAHASIDDWPSVPPGSDIAAATVEAYRRNVRAILRAARERGIAAVVIQPAANLRSWWPNRSVWPDEMSGSERKACESLVAEARAAWQEYHPEKALASLDAALAKAPRHAGLQFQRGQCLEALHRYDEARAAFEAARDLDALPLRATRPILETLAEVAREEEAIVIDANEIFAAVTAPRTPGDETFIDNVHPYLEGHALIAREIYRELVRHGLWRGREDLEEGSKVSQLLLSPSEEAGALLVTGDYLSRFGRDAYAEKMFRTAVERDPASPEGWIRLGRFLARQGRLAEARQSFEKAIGLAPRRRAEIQQLERSLATAPR